MNKIQKKILKNLNKNLSLYKFHFVIIIVIMIIIYLYRKKIFENFSTIILKSGIDRVDGVVYINLESRDDRKKLIKDEMQKMKIPENKINKVSGVYIPNNGHKGCVQAHILALRLAKMNNWKNTFILEDDAVLTCDPEEFQSKLEEIYKYLESNNFKEKYKKWDVIMLSTANLNKEELDNKNIFKIKFATLGTAYIVNNHYIDTLLNLFEDCNLNMTYDKWGEDDGHEPNALDQRWADLQKENNWFTYKENLIHQRNIWSTTNNRGVSNI